MLRETVAEARQIKSFTEGVVFNVSAGGPEIFIIHSGPNLWDLTSSVQFVLLDEYNLNLPDFYRFYHGRFSQSRPRSRS
jgi:hypothetical protein